LSNVGRPGAGARQAEWAWAQGVPSLPVDLLALPSRRGASRSTIGRTKRHRWSRCAAQLEGPGIAAEPDGDAMGVRLARFTHVAACTLALSPIPDTHSEGFSQFVTSVAAPVASGWSAGLHPLESVAFSRRTPEPDIAKLLQTLERFTIRLIMAHVGEMSLSKAQKAFAARHENHSIQLFVECSSLVQPRSFFAMPPKSIDQHSAEEQKYCCIGLAITARCRSVPTRSE
jgi:hypothetical protein